MTGGTYQGIADPGSASSDWHARDFHIDQKLASMSIGTLVKIVRAPYDANGNAIAPGTAGPIGYIDVQPLVNQVDGHDPPVATPHGTVYKITYHRYQGGNGAFISDPVVGDIGFMSTADRDTSVVRSTAAQANPGSSRQFDRADGHYLGQAVAMAPSQYFAWLAQGFNLHDAYGNVMQGTPSGVLINGVLISLAGDVTTKHGTSLDHHVNTNVTTGSANTGPPP